MDYVQQLALGTAGEEVVAGEHRAVELAGGVPGPMR